MTYTVAGIQAGASHLTDEIRTTNRLMAELAEEVRQDKKIIAKARTRRDKDIIHTIFGFLLGGPNAIIAGMGVSSIAEAEGKVRELENKIKDYQHRLAEDWKNIAQDQAQLVSLNALTLPARNTLDDVEILAKTLENISTGWNTFAEELDDCITRVSCARSSEDITATKTWFTATGEQWQQIQQYCLEHQASK